jgi:nicotinamide-nucleotide amidase
MPARNKAQAYFPQGSQVVPNPEGTAPGIDLIWQAAPDHATRFFCLPGVPAEMFQMWKATVGPAIQLMTGNDSLIHHHVLHCFGTGESRMEEMLGDLTKRGRDPIVGITASRATISLRISTRGPNEESCLAKLKPTLEDIDQRLGNLVFGENGMELAEVVLDLLSQRGQTISIVDCGLGGAVAWSLHEAIHLHNDYQDKAKVVKTTCTGRLGGEELSQRVAQTKSETDADFVIGIGPVQQVDGVPTFEAILQSDDDQTLEQFNYAGHTDFRHIRSVKQVLNLIRLLLLTP